MLPGGIPGWSRLEQLGRRRGIDRVFRDGRRWFVTKVNHFYNGALLVLNTVDGRVLHELGIEAEVIRPDLFDWLQAEHGLDQGFGVVDQALGAGREAAFGARVSAVVGPLGAAA